MIDDFPEVPKDLVEALESIFPASCRRLKSWDEVCRTQGSIEVIDLLRMKYQQQQEARKHVYA